MGFLFDYIGMENEEIRAFKEFINLKFQSLEEKIEMRNQYNDEKMEDFEKKLDRHSERIFKLEKSTEKTMWDKIKDSFISWAVPFVMAAILFYIAHGISK